MQPWSSNKTLKKWWSYSLGWVIWFWLTIPIILLYMCSVCVQCSNDPSLQIPNLIQRWTMRACVYVWVSVCVYFCIYLICFIIAFHSAFIITYALSPSLRCDWSIIYIHFLILKKVFRCIFLGNIQDWWEIWAVHTPPHYEKKKKSKFVYVLFVHVYL